MSLKSLPVVAAMAAALVALSPGGPALAGSKPFSHDKAADLQGYYVPAADPQSGAITEIRVGNFVLNALSIGDHNELKAFEKTGRSDIPTYAPVMLGFDDTTSPKGENELGQTYYERGERVLPTGYELTATSVSFHGVGQTLGPVTFEGAPDLARIRAARKSPSHLSDGPALVGTLTVGDTVIRDVKLMWYGGE
jgi:hypothetical protein